MSGHHAPTRPDLPIFTNMKFGIVIIASILFSLPSAAQQDSSLIGAWKLIALTGKDMYYDLVKDSFSVSVGMGNQIGSVEKKEEFKETLYSVFNGLNFYFEKDGSFRQTSKGQVIITGNYQTLPEQDIVEIRTRNSRGELLTKKMPFEIKSGRLYLFVESKDKMFDYLLERIE